MKKALILSYSTGQGHNSCARAVKEYFDGRIPADVSVHSKGEI